MIKMRCNNDKARVIILGLQILPNQSYWYIAAIALEYEHQFPIFLPLNEKKTERVRNKYTN
jgi:hypothetical protein